MDHFATARSMLAAVRDRKISARELLDLHLDRIATVNGSVNAVVSLDEERARHAAAQADERQARGEPLGTLHGLPFAFKDTHAVAGWRTTYGSPVMADHVPDHDDLVVERVRRAGVVVLGKTNVPEFAAGSHTFNPVFGTTTNPFDLGRSAGGSSGGAAAALASGMVPLADGSDMGGSLRNPASFCNVVGLRPCIGRVPEWPRDNAWETTSVSGPMARNVGDLALLLSVMAGPDPRVPTALGAEDLTPPLAGSLAGLRVAFSVDLGGAFEVDRAVAGIVTSAETVFAEAGATVSWAHPDLPEAEDTFRTLRAWHFQARYGPVLAEHPDLVKPSLADNIRAGESLTGADVARAYRQRTTLSGRMTEFFGEYDVLVLPVSQVPPFPADEEYPKTINGREQATYLDWMRSAYFITVTGCPAISVPAGFTLDGLPVGIQLIAAHNSERRLLEVAQAFEDLTRVGDRHPGIGVRPGIGARPVARPLAPTLHRVPETAPAFTAISAGVGGRTLRIGIDTGGTFTDVVAFDEESGELVTTKTPSTPGNPADGFMTGIEKVLGLAGLPPGNGDAIAAVSHGTTVATNQLLEGKVDRLGFVTTEGYDAILEIARQSVPDSYGNSYFWVKPDRIVPRHLVRTVGGRLDFTGAEIRPFDEDGARRVARWFRARGIDTLGVCFLHAYANPEHEERMRRVLAEEHPEAVVSISSEVLREYREYERSVTTLVDAAVKPMLSRYLGSITTRLDAYGSTDVQRRVPFCVMKSNGGVLSADEVVHQPITTVLSGPAAGALGAALVAQVAGFDRVLTCDGGGTSTDVSVVVDGQPTLTTEGSVGVYPSKIPMIDVVTVGAGGGSIAWLSPEGSLKVGPRSAGADPGPLCYAKSGTDVTITDAHLVLGRIPPHLLGGEIPLDVPAARKGLEALAGRLAMSVEECAAGVLEISAWNQANALRQITVKRGLDVRDFTLTTFGGSGSLLLCRLVDILDLPAVVVPPNPGNVSAFGLLTVDVKNDYVRTHVSLHDGLAPSTLARVYDELTDRARAALEKEGFAPGTHRFARTADLRYFGQAFEVRVPVPDGDIDTAVLDLVADRFHAEHRSLYGYDFAGDSAQQVEWVNLRVSGIGPIRRPRIVGRPVAGDPGEPVVAGVRPVCFDAGEGYVDTAVHWRPDLRPGQVVAGPAVIEEYGATVPLHPGFSARIDAFLNIVVTREGGPA
jgi:N-methylhydantoinase A